jgi:5-methylcytosine-specific restriction protein A
MPLAPLRKCPAPGCRALVRAGRCSDHGCNPSHRWNTDRRPDVKRLAGRANQRRRERIFGREPLCKVCAEANPPRVAVAVVTDHVIPLAEGGADDESNLVGLCAACHRVKTQQESRRGRRRGSGSA